MSASESDDPPLRSVFTVTQLVLLAGMSGMGPLGTDAYLASMPEVRHDFDTSASAVQLTLTGFMVGLAVGQIVLGPLSDRLGRYRLLVAGVAVLVLSSIAAALAPNVALLIVARIVQGLSGAAALVLSRAVVADLTRGKTAATAFSVLGSITGIAPIVAPIAGGVIQQWGDWRGVFWMLAIVSALLFLGVIVCLRETLPPDQRRRRGLRETASTALGILTERQFFGYGLTLWFSFVALFAYIAASPFVVQGMLGFSPLAYTIVFAVNAVGLTATASLSAALARTVGPARLIRFGVASQALGAVALAVIAATGAITPWTILPALFFIPVGMGLVTGNGTALAIERVQHARGTALAVLGCLQFGIGGLVAPLVGVAGVDSIVPLACVALGGVAVASVGVTLGGRAYRLGQRGRLTTE